MRKSIHKFKKMEEGDGGMYSEGERLIEEGKVK
jgi:hypothetical protein